MKHKTRLKTVLTVSSAALVVTAISLATLFFMGNVFKSETGINKSGGIEDSEIIFLRSIQAEYEIANLEKRNETEYNKECMEKQGLLADTWINCYTRISWSYDGHEIFENLDQLARDRNMLLSNYYAKAGNSRYYLGQANGKQVCFHFSEFNDPEGKLYTNVVLATGNDDICKTLSSQ